MRNFYLVNKAFLTIPAPEQNRGRKGGTKTESEERPTPICGRACSIREQDTQAAVGTKIPARKAATACRSRCEDSRSKREDQGTTWTEIVASRTGSGNGRAPATPPGRHQAKALVSDRTTQDIIYTQSRYTRLTLLSYLQIE